MGVGQPLSMKLKNVHLPHPHPKGGFWDPSLGGGLVLPPSGSVSVSHGFFCSDSKPSLGRTLCLVVQVVELSDVSTPGEVVSEVPSGVVFSSWLGTSTERENTHLSGYHSYCQLVQMVKAYILIWMCKTVVKMPKLAVLQSRSIETFAGSLLKNGMGTPCEASAKAQIFFSYTKSWMSTRSKDES